MTRGVPAAESVSGLRCDDAHRQRAQDEMAGLGSERGVEVSLFLGPRGAWDIGRAVVYDIRTSDGEARGERRRRARHCGSAAWSFVMGFARSSWVISECSRRSGGCGAAGDLPTRHSCSRHRCCCRVRTARRRRCSRCSALPPSTLQPISRSVELGELRVVMQPRRSTSMWRCRTTRAGSCASTRCRT